MEHILRMKLALQEAEKCRNIKFFGVGAVIYDCNNILVSSGYTDEVLGCHAEEVAIQKAISLGSSLRNSSLYSTMEPCSVRLSGKRTCADRILEAGISIVYFGCKEPPEFVQCRGEDLLRQHGVVVVQVPELVAECELSVVKNRI